MVQAQLSPRPATPGERRAVSIDEARGMIGCSESFLRELLTSGMLRSRKVGRRVFIPIAAVDEFLAGDRAAR